MVSKLLCSIIRGIHSGTCLVYQVEVPIFEGNTLGVRETMDSSLNGNNALQLTHRGAFKVVEFGRARPISGAPQLYIGGVLVSSNLPCVHSERR